MTLYKGYPIYGIAVSTTDRCWSSRGLIFDRDQNQTIEIKRIEGAGDLTFKRKQLAEEHALKLCRSWIDEQPPAPV